MPKEEPTQVQGKAKDESKGIGKEDMQQV